MSTTIATGNNTGLPDGTKIADDLIGTGTPPSTGDRVQYVKLDVGAAGLSSPVSGAVPVSASALPLPAGAGTSALQSTGNTSLASIDTKTPALGQALAAASVPVILPTATITTLTPPAAITGFALEAGHLANLDVLLSTRLKPADTLAGVTTVAAVTAITNALPAGTNRVGSVRPVDSADADLTAAKGSQPSRALGTQDLKDAGRSAVMITVEALAGAAAEAIVTMTWSKGFAAVTTGTSYNVTAGKTLRLQSLVITLVSTTTTANSTRIRLRVNSGGAAVITSNLQFSIRLAWPSATFIANEAYTVAIPFPDGFEIPGGGGLAITHVEAAANGTIDISLSGYEY